MEISTLTLPKAIVLLEPAEAPQLCGTIAAAWGKLPWAADMDEVEAAVGEGARLIIADEARWRRLLPGQRALFEERVRSQQLRVVVFAQEAHGPDDLLPPVHLVISPSTPPEEVEASLFALLAEQDPRGRIPWAPSNGGRRVLVVDDSELLNRITCSVLRQAGYGVTCITNPMELYRHVMGGGQDLVLVDYNMPALRGDWLVQIVRRAGVQVPLVLYSNAPEGVLEAAMRECGASGYIRKGVGASVLLARLDALFRELVPGRGGAGKPQ